MMSAPQRPMAASGGSAPDPPLRSSATPQAAPNRMVGVNPESRPSAAAAGPAVGPAAAPTPAPQATVPSVAQNRVFQQQAPARPATAHAPSPRSRRRSHSIRRVLFAILPIIAVFVTLSLIGYQAPVIGWPLTRVTAPVGFLILTLLSKAIDWGLAQISDLAWERVRWGPWLRKCGSLPVFLVMGTGFEGWCSVILARSSTAAAKRGINAARILACFRVALWFALQFPGIVIMSAVDPNITYEPLTWNVTSGGYAPFNVSYAFQLPVFPLFFNYIFRLLQDPTQTFLLDSPITSTCQTRTSCQSYLLTGGISTLYPTVYDTQFNSSIYTDLIVKDSPVYQIDAWDLTGDRSAMNWTDEQCRVYNSGGNTAQICMRRDHGSGPIVAGVRACDSERSNATSGTCAIDGGWNTFRAFTSAIQIYRVKADYVVDLRTTSILAVTSVSDPEPQDDTKLSTGDLLTAIDNVLCPFRNSSGLAVVNTCNTGGLNFYATDQLYLLVYMAYVTENIASANDLVRNLIGTVLSVYQEVFIIGFNLPLSEAYNLTGPMPGVPAENVFTKSRARPLPYIEPRFWTVIAFIVTAGLFLVAAVIVVMLTSLWNPVGPSSFSELNGFKLATREEGSVRVKDLKEIMEQKVTNQDILEAASKLKVQLQATVVSNSGHRP